MKRYPWFLSALPFLLASEGGGGGGGGNPTLTLEERLQNAETEAETLRTQNAGLTTQVGTLNGRLTALTSERDTLTTTVNTLTGQLATANADLATARGAVTSLTTERDDSRTNTSRLESYCKLHGLDPSKAPATPENQGGGGQEGELTIEKVQAITDPKERTLAFRKLEKQQKGA